ncbi:unnamed protein product [marine sediment metagenome]|uniref:Uncharacterized protein n=1 Tax=marine sediment metagenome TaxID=412755 RepID=X0XPA8_9ZZZZ
MELADAYGKQSSDLKAAKEEIESLREQLALADETTNANAKIIKSLRQEIDEQQKRMQDQMDLSNEWKRRAEDRQAQIDALMLEHCPDEMTPEQIAEYEKNQEKDK